MFKTIIGMTAILSLVAIAISAMAIYNNNTELVVALVSSVAGFIGTIAGYAYGIETAREKT